jgi:hypothetical protein
MAFPFLSEAGFESGTLGHFDAEVDTESRLDFPHYTTLAATPGRGLPWRGAYCMRVELANDGSPADAYVQETGAWDLSASGSIFFRLQFFLSADTVMANADEFAILQLWSSTNTVEGGAWINFTTANGFRVGIGELAATSFKPLTLGQWHTLELKFVIDSGAPNDGTIDGWLDGSAFTQVTGLDQGAITSGVVGVIAQDAGTTKGWLLFDDIIAAAARIFPPVERFPQQILLTASGHVFVGGGELEKIDLLAGAATDNVLSVYDTDRAYTSDASNVVLELKNTVNNERVALWDEPVRVHRGCYVALSGTNPRALAKIKWSNTQSDGALRQHAITRTPNPLGA